jgi:hypothetical protein
MNMLNTYASLLIVRRAGVQVWPKLFVNLRSSLATELAETFPAYVCERWLGHSAVVANRHYRQLLTDHFERAISNETRNTKCNTVTHCR